MEKKLFYVVDNGDASCTAELSGCLAWMDGDMEANEYREQTPPDDLPTYTFSPVWMTDEEYDKLPEAE